MRLDISSAHLHFGQITKATLRTALQQIRSTTIHITPTDTYEGAKQVRSLVPTYNDRARKIGLNVVVMDIKGAGGTTFSNLSGKADNDVLDPSRTLWTAPAKGTPARI